MKGIRRANLEECFAENIHVNIVIEKDLRGEHGVKARVEDEIWNTEALEN